MKNTAVDFQIRAKRNFKNCTIFNAAVSIPFVFAGVTVGLHLKSLGVLQLASNYRHCQSSKQGEAGALGLQATTSKASPGQSDPQAEMLVGISREQRTAAMHQQKEQQVVQTPRLEKQVLLFPSNISKAKGWGFFACH